MMYIAYIYDKCVLRETPKNECTFLKKRDFVPIFLGRLGRIGSPRPTCLECGLKTIQENTLGMHCPSAGRAEIIPRNALGTHQPSAGRAKTIRENTTRVILVSILRLHR